MQLTQTTERATDKLAVIVGAAPNTSIEGYFNPSGTETVQHLKAAAVEYLQSHLAPDFEKVEMAPSESVLAFAKDGNMCESFTFSTTYFASNTALSN